MEVHNYIIDIIRNIQKERNKCTKYILKEQTHIHIIKSHFSYAHSH